MRVSSLLRAIATVMGILLLFCFLLVASGRGATREFDEQKFQKTLALMDTFERKLYGCPPTGYPPEVECREGRGDFDAGLYLKMMKQGRSFFGGE